MELSLGTAIFSASSLRDLYQHLATYRGVLRSESLYRDDLPDLCDFKFHQRLESSPHHIGIQRISMGKSNTDKVLYGRTIRHRQSELCSIEALGFYLLTRFDVSKAIEEIRFDDNKTWFNKKLLKQIVSSSEKEDK